jgi:hypothetical protein
MRSFRFAGLVATVALAAACDSTPTAPVETIRLDQGAAIAAQPERIVEEHVYELDGVQIVGWCGEDEVGEPVELTGRIVEKIVITQLPNGLEQVSVTTTPVDVAGTGVESGDPYLIVSQDQYFGRANEDGSGGSYSYRMWFRNRNTGFTFYFTTTGNYRLDEYENIIVERERERSSCTALVE